MNDVQTLLESSRYWMNVSFIAQFVGLTFLVIAIIANTKRPRG